MKITTTYKVKIKHYNHIFKDTVRIYRSAVDYIIKVCLNEWNDIQNLGSKEKYNYCEKLIHKTDDNPNPKYEFDTCFYKMPSYIRRAATAEAIGKVSSYKSSLSNWEDTDPYERGQIPSYPKAGFIYPSLYKGNMYQFTGTYKAKIKVYIRNTWDWVSIDLKKSDMNYIKNHCSHREMKSPTLRKRGKEWFLEFPFEEEVKLNETDIHS